jgi:phosphoglycolate phosphatase
MSTAVVFDLDGTLADTATDIARSLNAVLASHKLQAVELDVVRYMIGRGPVVLIERAIRHLGVRSDEASVAGLSAAFIDHYTRTGHQRTTLFPGVRDCLRKLAGTGVGVCSNKPHAACESLLSELGIADLVSAVQGSAPGVPTKPDPTMLHRVLSALGAEKARSVYVGDSETDVLTARAAGLPVVLVSWGYSDRPVTEIGADAVIDSFDELPVFRSRFSSRPSPAGSPLRRSTGT